MSQTKSRIAFYAVSSMIVLSIIAVVIEPGILYVLEPISRVPIIGDIFVASPLGKFLFDPIRQQLGG